MGSLPVFTANSALSWAWNQFQKRPSGFCPQSEEARSKLAGSRATVLGARSMKVLSTPPNELANRRAAVWRVRVERHVGHHCGTSFQFRIANGMRQASAPSAI